MKKATPDTDIIRALTYRIYLRTLVLRSMKMNLMAFLTSRAESRARLRMTQIDSRLVMAVRRRNLGASVGKFFGAQRAQND